jgi:hypothetical protein
LRKDLSDFIDRIDVIWLKTMHKKAEAAQQAREAAEKRKNQAVKPGR